MKVFITGVAGFLGSHLADRFIAEGHTVIGIDNLIGGYRSNVPEGVTFHRVDCLDHNLIDHLLSWNKPDMVVHTAALAYEGLSVFSPFIVTQNIYGATTSVLSLSLKHKVKKFVFCSSMARYGTQKTTPFTETMTPAPQDPYGIAKLAAEDTLKVLARAHGMEFVIVVPHNIIGPRQKYDDPYRNVVSIMINRMLQGKPPIIYGDGKQVRCFSFISDTVRALYEACILRDAVGETINIGPDEEEITIQELAERLMKIMDFNGKPLYFNDRPCEVKHATCSANKARKILGYKTSTDLDSGLCNMVAWIKRMGTKPFNYHIPIEIYSDDLPETWRNRIM